MNASTPIGLNENHERHLLASISYAAQLLRDCEQILADSEQPQAFSKYTRGLTPPQRKITRDYLNRLHQQLLHFLDAAGLTPPPPKIDPIRGIVVAMMFMEDTFDEMRGSKMSGFGPVPPEAERVLDGAVSETLTLIQEVERFLSGDPGEVLRNRLARLPAGQGTTEDLLTLSRIIDEHGLVDFRAALTTLVDRALEQTFEVAIVGRVSSGKSSLLNALIGASVLPTGVLPVTAFPTRVRRGAAPAIHVAFANGRTESLAVDRIGEFVAESQNPGNEKRLTRLLLEYPTQGLPEGVMFVDTPGLGSLASAGALQTFAYLPRCDQATFLLDATAPLVDEDLSLLGFLHDSGIATSVLLSKADLLSSTDLAQVQTYVGLQIRDRIGADLRLRAVSALPTHAALLSAWIEDEIKPLGARAQAHGQDALVRKVAALRTHVSDALKGLTRHNRVTIAPTESRRLQERVRDVAKRIDEVDRDVRDLNLAQSGLIERTLSAATTAIVKALGQDHRKLDDQVVRTALMRPAQALAETTAATVGDLAKQAAEALVETARAIGAPPPSFEASGVEREVPLIDIPTLTTTFQPPLWARVSRLTLDHWVAERVRSEWSDAIDRAVGNYVDVLRRWGTERLTSLRREFDAQSRPLLAQILMRPPTHAKANSGTIDQDLEWLIGTSQPHS